MTPSLEELRRMPLNRAIELHDEKAKDSSTSVNYYLNEIARRDQERAAKAIVFLTGVLVALTVVLIWLTWTLAAKGG